MKPLPRSLATPLTLCCAVATLASCSASDGGYPSLAPRTVEAIQTGPVVAEQAAAPAQRDAALDARAATLLAAAREAGSRFDSALGAARRATASAGGAGSESWIAAQQEVTRLDQARSPFVSVMADIDALRLAQAQRRDPVALTALEAAWAEVSAIDAAQAEALSALIGSLSRP